jgi:hypothetical protein
MMMMMIDEKTNGSSFWGGILLVLLVQWENVENLWIGAKAQRVVSRFLL